MTLAMQTSSDDFPGIEHCMWNSNLTDLMYDCIHVQVHKRSRLAARDDNLQVHVHVYIPKTTPASACLQAVMDFMK